MRSTTRPSPRRTWRPGALAAVAPLVLLGVAGCASTAGDTNAAPMRGRWPAGSVTTRAIAESALAATRARNVEIDAVFVVERDRCNRTFFVNQCLDHARQQQIAGLRDLRAVEVEAHDRIRLLDAAERAEARARDEAQREARAEQDRQDEAARRKAYDERQRQAQERQSPQAVREAEATRGETVQRRQRQGRVQQQREADRQLSAPARATNAERFADKQREAASYAKQKSDEKAENEKKRAERIQERDARAAAAQRPPAVPEADVAPAVPANPAAPAGAVTPAAPAAPATPGTPATPTPRR